jgi:hypothetical protein
MSRVRDTKLAGLVWVIAVAFLVGYELYAISNTAPNDTLSEAIWIWAQHPMISFVVGVLVGHFWWQRKCGD